MCVVGGDKAATFLLYGSHFVQGRIELSGLALVVKAVYIASVAGLVESLQRFTMGTLVSFLFLVFTKLEMPFPMLWCFDALHVHCHSLLLSFIFFFFDYLLLLLLLCPLPSPPSM